MLDKVIEYAKSTFSNSEETETQYSVYIDIKDKYYISYTDDINSISKKEYYPQGHTVVLLTDSGNEDNSNTSYLSRWRDGDFNLYTPGGEHTLSNNLDLTLGRYYKVTVTVSNATPTLSCKLNNVVYKGIMESPSAVTLSSSASSTCYVLDGCYIEITPGWSQDEDQKCTVDGGDSKEFTVESKTYTVSISSSSCITSDTLIKLANGQNVRVDSLTGDEMLLVWNHIAGQYEIAPIAYIICHDSKDVNHKVIQLNFDDGTYIKMIQEHVFFDVELNKYVSLTEDNVNEFINHHFTKLNESNELEHIKLVSYDVYYEMTRSYEVVTYNHLVAITNNIISASAFIDPLLNVFEFNSNYQYDQEKMIEDINKYGLYTYEEFSHLITEDVFNMHNVAYLKVAVGKGIMTWEDIIWLIEAYYAYAN